MNAVRRPTIFQQHRAALTTIARRCGPIRREDCRVEVALLLTLALMRGEIPHVEVRF